MGKILELLLNLSPALENGKTLASPKTWGCLAGMLMVMNGNHQYKNDINR